MNNRIPPLLDNLDLERPPITSPVLTLTADTRGFLRLQWMTPGLMYYGEKYHVTTHKRVGWNISLEPISN